VVGRSVDGAGCAAPWNGDAFRTRLFDALSLLLPCGEAFVIGAVSDWLAAAPQAEAGLRAQAERFVREEQSHQRAHRLYNDRLARSGAPAQALEQRIESAVRELSHLDLGTRLAMSAAFEHLTALLSTEVLRGAVWLTATPCRESQLWRWHCAEEIAHCHVTAHLLRAGKVGYLRRAGSLALATCFLGIDLTRLVFALCAHDVRCGAVSRGRLLLQAAGLALRACPGVLRMAAGGLRYLMPMHRH
jgi:predicted metal-dependent hydrolase